MLVNRWFRDFDWSANALSSDDFQRFKSLEAIFQKYGDRYRIDYLMAAAQGFQESRLNQDAKSAAGAIGIMQLLPSTAADPNVGIADIGNAEANIHAGMKYLDFLRDRYFGDLADEDVNKTLLALAAYNVGPGRMIGLREEAERQGYDPDVWFDNVEVIAARKVGREPVQYVSNIFKYYTAYRMSFDLNLQRQAARERAGVD